jgi:hypothetical protein
MAYHLIDKGAFSNTGSGWGISTPVEVLKPSS